MLEWGPSEEIEQATESLQIHLKKKDKLRDSIEIFLHRSYSIYGLKLKAIDASLTSIFEGLAGFMHSLHDAILAETSCILSAVEGLMGPWGNQTSQHGLSIQTLDRSARALGLIAKGLYEISESISDLKTGVIFLLPWKLVANPGFQKYIGRINNAGNTYTEVYRTFLDDLQVILSELVNLMKNPNSREVAADLINNLERFIEDTDDRVKRCISEFSPGNQHRYNNRYMRQEVKERLKCLKLLLQN